MRPHGSWVDLSATSVHTDVKLATSVVASHFTVDLNLFELFLKMVNIVHYKHLFYPPLPGAVFYGEQLLDHLCDGVPNISRTFKLSACLSVEDDFTFLSLETFTSFITMCISHICFLLSLFPPLSLMFFFSVKANNF